MSWWLVLVIVAPILFVVGTVVNALKEQQKLEHGILQKILQERRRQQDEYLKQQAERNNKK